MAKRGADRAGPSALDGVSGEMMAANLAAKLGDKGFCADINTMVKTGAPGYDPQEARHMVTERLLLLVG